MDEIINKVIKIITEGNNVAVIIQTKGENDYWVWEVSLYDIQDYFIKTNQKQYLINPTSKAALEIFANSIEASDKGVSSGSYDSVDEILKEYEILK